MLSANARFVAFVSDAPNLVTNDDLELFLDVFVRDLETDSTVLISVNTNGIGGGNANSSSAVLSSNGQFVVFASAAGNLIPGDTNEASDVFVRDLVAGVTQLVSVDRDGGSPANPSPLATRPLSGNPLISPDGRWVVFESQATNLVETADTNQETDAFARDLQTGTMHLISLNANGTATGNGRSEQASMTPDGKFVAFVSTATDLVPGVTNRLGDVYVRDLNAGQTFWASTNVGAAMPDAAGYQCFGPALSADGRFVAFKATAIGVTNEILFVHHDLLTGVSTVLTRETAADSWPQLSADGRFVAYESTNQVYHWDRDTGSNVLVSVATDGTNSASAAARAPLMTPNGLRVVFLSSATNLVDGGINGVWQIYQRDLEHDVTTLVSADDDGRPGAVHLDVALPSLSPDGRWVAFSSSDDRLVADDLNGMEDVFVCEVTAGATRLVSARDPALACVTGSALSAREVGAISADGKRIGFVSLDGNLAPGDTNGWQDAFVQDVGTGSLTPLSRR